MDPYASPTGSEPPEFSPRPWPRREQSESPLSGRRVLILGEDLEWARGLGQELSKLGPSTQASSGGDALGRHLGGADWDAWVVLTSDLDTADQDEVRRRVERAPLILLGPDAATSSLADLAFAILSEEATADDLHRSLGRAFEQRSLKDENELLRARLDGQFQLESIITRDPEMKKLLGTLEAVADTRANVLLCGESGTGKTMLAHTLHRLSERREGPFVVVNCGALPDALLESELFGHTRGAFTGAVGDKVGRFEEANGGTIFLDEINSASLDLQVKLLRVIQERTFERLGDSKPRTTDVRLVTATNADLKAEIQAGNFREDLYYRIHVVALELPPLRDRPRDIVLLAERFLERFAKSYERGRVQMNEASRAALVAYPWPGNVRELENTLERAVLLARDHTLSVADLGPELVTFAEERNPGRVGGFHPHGSPLVEGLELGLAHLERLPPLKKALEGPERAILVRALELCEGSRTRAAEMLEINRTTLFHKMRKYDLLQRSFSPSEEVP